MRVRWKIEGLDDLRSMLKRLSDKASRKVQREGVRAGAVVVHRMFRALTPVDSGRLKRAQIIKRKTYRNSNTAIAVVGADYAIGPHAHLIEWGTKDRYRKKYLGMPGRGYTGRMKPTQLYTHAFESAKPAAEREIVAEMQFQLDKAINEL